jgi:type IV pilus assembly protein PilV
MAGRPRDEEGLSLIELLIAVVVLGIGGVGVLAAMTTSIRSADVHRSLSEGEVVTRDFAEAVRSHAMRPTTPVCPSTADVTPPFTPPPGYTTAVTAIEYWLPSTSDPTSAGSFTANRSACTAAHAARCANLPAPIVTCDASSWRISLRVTASGETGASRTTQDSRVVVRRGNP